MSQLRTRRRDPALTNADSVPVHRLSAACYIALRYFLARGAPWGLQRRKLAAILAGYTRLTGADEAGTLERLRMLRRDPALVEPSRCHLPDWASLE